MTADHSDEQPKTPPRPSARLDWALRPIPDAAHGFQYAGRHGSREHPPELDSVFGSLWRTLNLDQLGLLVASLSLVVAAVALNGQRREIREQRLTREAELFGLAAERMEAARTIDKEAGQSAVSRAGQIPLLERMVRLDMDLENIHAHNVNLSAIDLTAARLADADLTGADLTGANLIRAELTYAEFNGATLTGTDFTGANLTSADFTDAALTGTDFTGANLTSANFAGATFTRTYPDSVGTPIARATLTDADLSGTELEFAVGLIQDQLDDACGLSTPTLPQWLNWQPKPCPATR